jgi:hypothetical protein
VAAPHDHHDGAHVLAGEAWLILPTWQLAASSSVSTAPQPVTPAPIRIVIDDRTGPPADGDGDGWWRWR